MISLATMKVHARLGGAQPQHLCQQQAIADALADLRAHAAGWTHEDVPDSVQQAVQQGLATVEAAEAAAAAAAAHADGATGAARRCLCMATSPCLQHTHVLPLAAQKALAATSTLAAAPHCIKQLRSAAAARRRWPSS